MRRRVNSLDTTPKIIGDAGERAALGVFGGVKTPGSGNGNAKADIWADYRYMVESKATRGKEIAVTREMVETLAQNARVAGREPVLLLTFDAGEFGESSWACVPAERLKLLLGLEDQVRKLTRSVGRPGG